MDTWCRQVCDRNFLSSPTYLPYLINGLLLDRWLRGRTRRRLAGRRSVGILPGRLAVHLDGRPKERPVKSVEVQREGRQVLGPLGPNEGLLRMRLLLPLLVLVLVLVHNGTGKAFEERAHLAVRRIAGGDIGGGNLRVLSHRTGRRLQLSADLLRQKPKEL